MDEKHPCPPANVLAELIEGKVVEPQLSRFSLHLEECPACQAMAQTLSPSDTLVESLRGEAPVPDQMARVVPRALIERLKQIPSTGSSIWPEQAFSFLAPAQEADEISRLGHYRVLKVLGQGGMGVVFLAEDPKLHRSVALKVMLPRLAIDPTAKDRFLREARAAARLKSDHIVTIYQVDEVGGVPFLAMELLEGQSLAEVLRAGQPLDIAEVVHIARDIARGLADAHDKGLIHRDIKPGNLWLERSPDGRPRVKILDFGLVRAALDDVHMTHPGSLVGTPAFMAPEQARGDKAVDARADLFSLGCVLYLLCTGEVPFQAETTIGTLMALAMHDPVAPARLNKAVSQELSQLILQLLQKDPQRRPQSAREVIARLTEIEQSVATTSATPSHKSQRNRTPILIGLLLAALAGISATILYWLTPDGRVVRIECNDPSIKVAFADGELKVTGAYNKPIVLQPGKVDLKISKQAANGDDFEFETDKLIVRKGDKIVLRIEVLDGKLQLVQSGKGVIDSIALPAKPGQIAVADPDRAAAQWVLSIGGKLQTSHDDRWIEATAELPKDEFALTQVNLVGKSVTDTGLAHCQDLKRLTELNLDSTSVTDAGMKHLEGCVRLARLLLYGTQVTDAGLAHLQNLKELNELGLGGGLQVTDAGLVHLKGLEKLAALHLDGTLVTDDGLPRLKALQGLRNVNLGSTQVTEAGLAQLKDFTALTEICLLGTPTTDATLGQLKRLKALTVLNVDGTRVTDEGLKHLQNHKSLTLVYIRNTNVTAKGLAEFHTAVPACRIFHTGGVIEANQ